jgi:hypothetical protein
MIYHVLAKVFLIRSHAKNTQGYKRAREILIDQRPLALAGQKASSLPGNLTNNRRRLSHLKRAELIPAFNRR